MDRLLDYLFGAASFLPHGYCLLWRPDLVALHVVSDLAIAAAYFMIPVGILMFVMKRGSISGEARMLAMLFSAFILLCGITHLGGVLTLWYPYYGLEGMLKALTAIVSLATAYVAWRLMPALVAWPSPRQLAHANERLKAEGAAREAAYQELEVARQRLEAEVAERTREVAETKQLFEVATKGAQISVYSQDRDLVYRWIHNPPLGRTAEEIVGRTDADMFPEAVIAHSVSVKKRVVDTGEPATYDLEIPGASGSTWFNVTVTPLRDPEGSVQGLVSAAIDISRSKRLEAMRADLSSRLAETVQRLDLALRSSEILVFVQDSDLRYVWANSAETPYGPLVGRTDEDLLEEPERSQLISYKRRTLASGEAQYCEVNVGPPEDRRWWDLHIEPNFDEAGEVTGITCAAVDVTERKHNEQKMRLVMRELTHRSKNLLAVVQAVARQTARQAKTVEDFVAGFGERVRSLAGAQDLLVAEDWGGVQLKDLILNQVGHYMPEERSRVVVDGPALRLPPEATQTIGLALHELATNAAKYGALSSEEGEVAIKWRIDRDAERPAVELEWRESGGPEVSPPTRRGFGRTVIERNVAASLGADVDLSFEPEGVRARFQIPLENVML